MKDNYYEEDYHDYGLEPELTPEQEARLKAINIELGIDDVTDF